MVGPLEHFGNQIPLGREALACSKYPVPDISTGHLTISITCDSRLQY